MYKIGRKRVNTMLAPKEIITALGTKYELALVVGTPTLVAVMIRNAGGPRPRILEPPEFVGRQLPNTGPSSQWLPPPQTQT